MSGAPPKNIGALGLLSIYFATEGCLGERSNIGPMLERMETFSIRRGVCRRCDGTGVRSTKALEEWLILRAAFETAWPNSIVEYEKLNPPPKGGSDDCYRCSGTGYTIVRRRGDEELTARPSGKEETGYPREPFYDGILLAAQASRVMATVGRTDPKHRRVLESYYGPAGELCSKKFGNQTLAVIPYLERAQDIMGTKSMADALQALRQSDQYQELELLGWALLESATRTWRTCCESVR